MEPADRRSSRQVVSRGDRAPVFALGTGRCGTHFLAAALAREPEVAAHHERHPLPDSFQRWCAWYGLAVDPAGFLANKAVGIRGDRATHSVSFEASAYLTLATPLLREAFSARFVLLVRRPDRVVRSFLAKGWYASELQRADPRLPAGYQPEPEHPHHPFARLAGFGDDGARWATLTRVGKLAYFWRRLNELALCDFAALPDGATRVLDVESFDYPGYKSLAEWMGFAPSLSEVDFAELAGARLGSLSPKGGPASWTAPEIREFEAEVAPVAERLGLEWRCARLREERPSALAAAPRALRRLGARLLGRT